MDDATRNIETLVLGRLGFAPADLLERRLGRVIRVRMNRLGLTSREQYAARVRSSIAELDALAQALTINETSFFREPRQFEALALLLPELARTAGMLRILSAGCSSGEEVYSLAITASRALPAGARFEVVGVDIDETMLARGREGLYARWSFREEGLALASGFVRPEGERWRVAPRIRQRVRFERGNLVEAAPAGPFHVIFSRNLLMYLTPETRRIVTTRLIDALPPGGLWFLGSSESFDDFPPGLERKVLAGASCYRKLPPVPAASKPLPNDPSAGDTTRVIVVTRSPQIRSAVRLALASHEQVEVVAEVQEMQCAAERIATGEADVALLDALPPEPVIQPGGAHPFGRGAALTLAGPRARAASFPGEVIALPAATPAMVRAESQDIAARLRRAAERGCGAAGDVSHPAELVGSAGAAGRHAAHGDGFATLLAIGSSTGGPAAITDLLRALPSGLGLAVVVAQHMPAGFTGSFADRLQRLTTYLATEAATGRTLRADSISVAPGGKLTIIRPDETLRVLPHHPADRYAPSITRLFRSIVEAGLAPRTIAVVLTGMGDDGADGLAALLEAGAETIVQDPDEAVVPGMVRAAIERGAGRQILRLEQLPSEIVRLAAVRG